MKLGVFLVKVKLLRKINSKKLNYDEKLKKSFFRRQELSNKF